MHICTVFKKGLMQRKVCFLWFPSSKRSHYVPPQHSWLGAPRRISRQSQAAAARSHSGLSVPPAAAALAARRLFLRNVFFTPQP